jgi:DNA-binding MarR family transcriptional regulator
MIIDKYVLLFPQALKVACRKLNLPTLKQNEIQIIIALKRLKIGRQASLYYFLLSIHKIERSTITTILHDLQEKQLVTRTDNLYSLSPLAIDLLSRIRSYMIQFRF